MTFIAAAAVVGGALIASNASKSAAKTQAASSDRATEAQREMFDQQVALQEPWRQGGGLGLNALEYGLGLSPTGTFNPAAPGASAPAGVGGAPAPAGSRGETADQIRARLAPQFTTTGGGMQFVPNAETGGQWVEGGPVVNEQALNAAIQQEMQRQQSALTTPTGPAAAQPAPGTANPAAPQGPGYGALMRNFSMADYQADPGLAFRQEEGERALTRAAGASGQLGSGKYLKDAMRFNSGLASQEYGNAFNRFNVNRDSGFNKLASIAGIGQTATNQVGAAAGNFGAQIGSNILGAGNARAAGQVGSASAINNGISQGVGIYQQQNMLNRFFPQGGVPQSPASFNGGGGFGTGNLFGNQDYGQNF